jgi:hypothetical protein
MNRENSPILVVGCLHSGTSLFLRILGSHSRICGIPFESRFALRWPSPCPESRRFFAHCDYYTLRMGKARWVEKTPSHILRLKEILEYFPGKVFLVLRDGRDVACSIRDRCGSLEVGIDRWIGDNRAGQVFWAHPQVRLIRYEQLVTDFENTVRDALDFIGEEYEDAIGRYHEEVRYFAASRLEKPPNSFGENLALFRNWQINQPIFDGRGKWLGLKDEEKEMIKAKAGAMLIECGYAHDLNW